MSHRGFTLIELMISVALFLIIMLAATTLFSRAADTQGKTVAIKNLQESTDYALQFIKREAETAKKGLNACSGFSFPCGGADDYFCTSGSGDNLYLLNKNDECVHYFLQTDSNGAQRLAVTRNNMPTTPDYLYVTPADVTVTNLKFSVATLTNNPEYVSARLTAFISARPLDGVAVDTLNLQTSVAIRPFICGQTIYDRDNFTYKTILIGDRCWLGENLKTRRRVDGTCINTASGLYSVTPDCLTMVSGVPNGNGGFPSSDRDCILSTGNARGTESDCSKGYTLYRWSAAMDGSTVEGAQGICPKGWHIPTYNEFYDFFVTLGGTQVAGGLMRVGGSSGYEAPLAGYRGTSGNSYSSNGSGGFMWTSTLSGWPFDISFSSSSTAIGYIWNDPTNSLSIRCIKDN